MTCITCMGCRSITIPRYASKNGSKTGPKNVTRSWSSNTTHPRATLRTEVRQTEDWRYGNHIPFLDDYLSSRSLKFLVEGSAGPGQARLSAGETYSRRSGSTSRAFHERRLNSPGRRVCCWPAAGGWGRICLAGYTACKICSTRSMTSPILSNRCWSCSPNGTAAGWK